MNWKSQFRNSLNALLTVIAWWSIAVPPALVIDWIVGWKTVPVLFASITLGSAFFAVMNSHVVIFDDSETLQDLCRGYKHNIFTVYLITPASYVLKKVGWRSSLLAA